MAELWQTFHAGRFDHVVKHYYRLIFWPNYSFVTTSSPLSESKNYLLIFGLFQRFRSMKISRLETFNESNYLTELIRHINKSFKDSSSFVFLKNEQSQCVPHPDIAMALYFTCITRNGCSSNVKMYSRKKKQKEKIWTPFEKVHFAFFFLSNFLLLFRLFMNVEKESLSFGFLCIAVTKCNCSACTAVVCVLYSCAYSRGSRFFLLFLFLLENAINLLNA